MTAQKSHCRFVTSAIEQFHYRSQNHYHFSGADAGPLVPPLPVLPHGSVAGHAAAANAFVAAHPAGELGRLKPALEARIPGTGKLGPGTGELAGLVLELGRLKSLLKAQVPGARKLSAGGGELAGLLLGPYLGYRRGWVDTQKLERQDLTLWMAAGWNQTLRPSRKMAGPYPLARFPARFRG